MLAIIRITFCILEYDIGRSFLIKKHICFQQWWKTESSHKKNSGITKVQFIQKVEIVSWNPIYRWNPENSQNKMVLSVLLGMRDSFEPSVGCQENHITKTFIRFGHFLFLVLNTPCSKASLMPSKTENTILFCELSGFQRYIGF